MEGIPEVVETSPSPLSSAVSPPHEVDHLSQILPLLGIHYCAKMDGPQPYISRY